MTRRIQRDKRGRRIQISRDERGRYTKIVTEGGEIRRDERDRRIQRLDWTGRTRRIRERTGIARGQEKGLRTGNTERGTGQEDTTDRQPVGFSSSPSHHRVAVESTAVGPPGEIHPHETNISFVLSFSLSCLWSGI
jgi:hypothetical protein